jgi:hypothetical protein
LVKTFWGWNDQQLPDGTVIWTSPTGHTYVTTPGSALLFPSLCVPTGTLTPPDARPARTDPCTDRTIMMPQRRRSRAENRANYIAVVRRHNRRCREAVEATQAVAVAHADAECSQFPPRDPDEPPPI